MSGQADFLRALFAPASPPPPGTCGPGDAPSARRFDVYRNNVAVALIEALQEAFPVIARLVGTEFFTAMAREFARQHPPDSPVMAFYGARFPGWLRDFPPVARLPYLPEVAAIEQARRESCHAADAAPLDAAALTGLNPDALAALRPSPHPSARLIATRYPALAIWAKNADHPALSAAPAGEVLICRPAMEVTIRPAPTGTAALLNALSQGVPLGQALPAGADHPALFACLFAAGALIPERSAS